VRFLTATRSADETVAVASRVASLLRPGDVVVLAGELGAGKTTFAKGVARGLGIDEQVVSPSFTIVRQYDGPVPLVHVDVYRLDHLQELHDLGFDELVGPEAVTLIEWGDRIGALLPRDRLEVQLAAGDVDDDRTVVFELLGASWNGRAEAFEGALALKGD
jgi:tRNA threonylcarbamoyladenosine biosynthesis protein TsaE